MWVWNSFRCVEGFFFVSVLRNIGYYWENIIVRRRIDFETGSWCGCKYGISRDWSIKKECRTIALPDNYPPGRLPPGQLPSWTIALQDNCPPGQLPSPYINIYYLDGYATAIVISLWMLLLLGYATIILALSEMWVPVLLNVSTGVSRTWWHLDWGHVITDRLSINV